MGLFTALFDRHPNMNRKQLRNLFDMMEDPYWQLVDACQRIDKMKLMPGTFLWPLKGDAGVLLVNVAVSHKQGGRDMEKVEIGTTFDLLDFHRKVNESAKRLREKVSPFPPELVKIPGR